MIIISFRIKLTIFLTLHSISVNFDDSCVKLKVVSPLCRDFFHFVCISRQWYLYLSRPARVGLKAKEEKEKIALCLRTRMERRKKRSRKLEEFGNAGFLAPENAKRRVSHRRLSFSVTLVVRSAAFFLGCYFLVALRAALFSRVPNVPCDPRSKYRHRYM